MERKALNPDPADIENRVRRAAEDMRARHRRAGHYACLRRAIAAEFRLAEGGATKTISALLPGSGAY
jgi:hypothetical protein